MRKHHDEMTGQLQKIQGLYQVKNRVSYSQEVAEGPQAAREVLVCAGDRVRDVVVTRDVLDRRPDLESLAQPHWTHVVPARVMNQISPDSQGILVVLNTAPKPDTEALFTGSDLVVLAVEMQDPGNAGTLIRTADAAGAGAVIFGSGSVDSGSPKVIRSAAGSTYHLPVVGGLDPRSVIAAAQRSGFQILAADGSGTSVLGTAELDLDRPTMWVFGNEARGLTPEVLDRVDDVIAIPIMGGAESLNVSAAAAVCLYASVFARTAASSTTLNTDEE